MEQEIQTIVFTQIYPVAISIAVAALCAIPIAYEREKHTHTLGIRTFPIVAVASAGFAEIALYAFANAPDAQARVMQGLITGIGFIGGGAILKGDEGVYGTATAASIWMMGLVGAACGFGHYGVAIMCTLFTYIWMRFQTLRKKRLEKQDRVKSPKVRRL